MKKIIVGNANYCDFKSIQQGINELKKLPESQPKELIILAGTYEERVTLQLSNITVSGLGQVEIIGADFAERLLNDGQKNGTFRSATFFIEGEHIHLKNLTIKNLAGQGEIAGQAVALFNFGNQTVIENCSLSAFQDTLCTGPLPSVQKDGTPFQTPPLEKNYQTCQQEYRDCYIEGTIDFIFGGANAVFESCQIHSCRRINPQASGFVTAASTPQNDSGFVFKNCYLTADSEVENVYLGRPWRAYAKTSFEQSFFDSHITPAGWDNWDNSENEKTTDYQEKNNISVGRVERPAWIKIK